MLMFEGEPNIYSVWLSLLGIVGTIVTVLAPVLAYWLYRKLGAIHTLVNGNLHTAQAKVSELRAKLQELGHNPDA